MFRRLIDKVLGSAVRAAEGLWDREARLALQRGRPPDWVQAKGAVRGQPSSPFQSARLKGVL